MRRQFILKITIDTGKLTVCDFLSKKTGISKNKIKDAMVKGALWIKKRGKLKRLRRATTILKNGDYIEFYYDEKLLSQRPPNAKIINDQGYYSVWYKPAGLMAQGTMFGDHCSLLRQSEIFFKDSHPVFLVHRLDRETAGLMIIAHSKKAAAALSELFRNYKIKKGYLVEVAGNFQGQDIKGRISLPLDGRPAMTEYEVMSYNPDTDSSILNVIIKTGRFHQIRRHLNMIGHPVVGDPLYGRGNKNIEGMKLIASSLSFYCPFRKEDVEFTLPIQHRHYIRITGE